MKFSTLSDGFWQLEEAWWIFFSILKVEIIKILLKAFDFFIWKKK